MYTPVTKCHSMWYSLLPSEAYLIQLQFHIIEYLTASDKWVILKNRKNDSLLHRLILLNLPVLILSDSIYLSYLFSSYLNFNLRLFLRKSHNMPCENWESTTKFLYLVQVMGAGWMSDSFPSAKGNQNALMLYTSSWILF